MRTAGQRCLGYTPLLWKFHSLFLLSHVYPCSKLVSASSTRLYKRNPPSASRQLIKSLYILICRKAFPLSRFICVRFRSKRINRREDRAFVSPWCHVRKTRRDTRERRASRVKIAICPLSIRFFETFDFRCSEKRSGLHPGRVKRDEQRGVSASTEAASPPARRDIARFLRKRS